VEIFEAREQHANLYSTDFEQGVVVWRPLNWEEYKRYRDLAYRYPHLILEIEDRIFKDCVLEDTTPGQEEGNAGIVTTVAREIIKLSGVIDPLESMMMLDAWRQTTSLVEEQMILIACKAFGYKPEELEKLEYQELLRRVAMAEAMLDTRIELKEAETPESDDIDFTKEAGELAAFEQQLPNLKDKFDSQRG